MNHDVAVKVDAVSKKYCKSLKDSMRYGICDIFKNTVGLASGSWELRKNEFWALNGISFEVKKGETFGVIGSNGSGKTTLLKLLNGIFWPDTGKISIRGRVGALIEVGAGFHPLLTGRENIYVNSAIFGMSKKDVDKAFDSIVDFADIGDFLDTPVKYYSSGMYVRLGFAVAVHCQPDILLIDEVLAVGDFSFQKKCHDKIREFKTMGKTILFVSHNLGAVKSLCNQTICLENGVSVLQGKSEEIVDYYLVGSALLKQNNALENECHMPGLRGSQRWGSGEMEISEVKIYDYQGRESFVFKTGDKIIISLNYKTHKLIKSLVFGIGVYNSEGVYCFGINSKSHDKVLRDVEGRGQARYIIESLPLLHGEYFISVSCHDDIDTGPFDHHDKKYMFKVVSLETEPFGVFCINGKWEIA
ncbi:MAG: ABC transporter ATP-binding protein [Candidatus Omnitrophica bacterium]|nr:ABC transporter ATP-binding protein [Candidatus Omnitrophota bacterium]